MPPRFAGDFMSISVTDMKCQSFMRLVMTCPESDPKTNDRLRGDNWRSVKGRCMYGVCTCGNVRREANNDDCP